MAVERYVHVLLNARKDIGLAVNTGKTKYMEIEGHRGMIANGHITIENNSHEKVKTFNNLGSFFYKSKFYSRWYKMQI